eukprot:4809728-Amphidinium_carterae.1
MPSKEQTGTGHWSPLCDLLLFTISTALDCIRLSLSDQRIHSRPQPGDELNTVSCDLLSISKCLDANVARSVCCMQPGVH